MRHAEASFEVAPVQNKPTQAKLLPIADEQNNKRRKGKKQTKAMRKKRRRGKGKKNMGSTQMTKRQDGEEAAPPPSPASLVLSRGSPVRSAMGKAFSFSCIHGERV